MASSDDSPEMTPEQISQVREIVNQRLKDERRQQHRRAVQRFQPFSIAVATTHIAFIAILGTFLVGLLLQAWWSPTAATSRLIDLFGPLAVLAGIGSAVTAIMYTKTVGAARLPKRHWQRIATVCNTVVLASSLFAQFLLEMPVIIVLTVTTGYFLWLSGRLKTELTEDRT